MPSVADLVPIDRVQNGAALAAVTVTVIASVSFSGGVPLSVTTTVIGKVPEVVGVQVKAPANRDRRARGSTRERERARLTRIRVGRGRREVKRTSLRHPSWCQSHREQAVGWPPLP